MTIPPRQMPSLHLARQHLWDLLEDIPERVAIPYEFCLSTISRTPFGG